MKLSFFTAFYPYGIGELWKEAELEAASEKFDEITVYPLYKHRNSSKRTLPTTITHQDPIFDEVSFVSSFKLKHLGYVLNRRFFYYLNEFISKRVYTNKSWIIRWLNAAACTEALLRSSTFSNLSRTTPSSDHVLYFFWGVGYSFIIPFLDKSRFKKIAIRFHGYDLFKERNQGYIPFQEQIIRGAHTSIAISEMGNEYLSKSYGLNDLSLRTFRLGAEHKGVALKSQDGILRIFSCSSMIPLKRVHLIVEALALLEFKVEWTHIGDGELMNEIEKNAASLPENISCKFPGWVKSDDVLNFYVGAHADLFLNVSSTEGVPVTIMEALSCGIPVLATDVGGTNELVDSKVGELLPGDLSAEHLAGSIRNYYDRSVEDILLLRDKALERYTELCDAKVNAKALAEFLTS